MKIAPTLAIVALSIAAFLGIRGCIRSNRANSDLRSDIGQLSDSARLWKDKYGTVHAEKEALELRQQDAVTFFSRQIDSMAALLQIKPRQVKSILYVPFRADINIDSLRQALASTDTLRLHTTDTVPGRIQINGQMSLTRYQRGTGFLGLKKRDFLDVHFDNPVFRPLDVTGFDITDKPKRFGIGPYIGYGWDGRRWAPSAGISVHYDFIRL